MGIIYLVKPNDSYLRSIDKLKPKDRKKAPECNNQNVKFGKHMGNMSSLHSRYESLVGNVNIKEIVRVDDDKIKNFEDRLKLCFSGAFFLSFGLSLSIDLKYESFGLTKYIIPIYMKGRSVFLFTIYFNNRIGSKTSLNFF